MKVKQYGLSSVEFALIAPMLFGLILSIVDFGRWMYTWNLLQEATRRAAEVAVVSDPNKAGIEEVIKSAGLITSSGGESTFIPGLKLNNLQISWLDANGKSVGKTTCTDYYRIRFASAQISDYTFEFVLPVDLIGFPKEIEAPPFEVILPRESMGWAGAEPPCELSY